MTPQEADAAFAFTAKLTAQLQRSRDITPSIRELFIPDFADRLRDMHTKGPAVSNRGFYLFFISPELVPQLSRGDLEKHFAETVNFWYLTMLRSFSMTAGVDGRATFEQALHPDVAAVFRQDPTLAGLLDKPNAAITTDTPLASSGKVMVRDAGELKKALAALERAASVIRTQITNPPVEATEQYRRFSKEFERAIQGNRGTLSLGARAMTCDASCGPLAGTRVFEVVSLPFLHLHLATVKDQLKITFIDLPTD